MASVLFKKGKKGKYSNPGQIMVSYIYIIFWR